MPRPFLTAEWRNLFLATYAVPPALLQPRLPPGLELDTRDGDAFVSLVAFEFCNTRVLGIAWPGYKNFAELNLRFYVRHGGERGVVFVREFVPARLVAWMARLLYNEPYRAAPLLAVCKDEPERRSMEYRLEWAGRIHRITVTGSKPGVLPSETSTEQLFKEHRWGFGVTRRGQPLRYEVVHPRWEVLPVQSFHIDLDWASVYGPEWGFLATATPYSTILAIGSAIAVHPHGKLELLKPAPLPTSDGLSAAARPQ
jgi:uncharacterized protein YqjF (DUF2071 family)